MSSAAQAPAEAAPTPAQLLFARALILTFELWPAMRLAVAEQWGGPESAAKRDYLISHLADEYGGATGAVGSVAEAKAAAASTAGAQSSTSSLPPPTSPDQDDVADLLDGYVNDEFEVRLEDGTSDWVAGRIVELHRKIFYSDSEQEARAAVEALEEACAKLRGTKAPQAQKGAEAEDFSGSDEDDEDDDEDEDGMDLDGQQQEPRQPRAKPQPEVDEDGFTTVVRRR